MPSTAKCTKEFAITAAPAPISRAPVIWAGTPPGTGSFTSQRVRSHGTTPAAVAGATAKTAVPIAARLDTTRGRPTVPRPRRAGDLHQIQYGRLAPVGDRFIEVRIPRCRDVVADRQRERVAGSRPVIAVPRVIGGYIGDKDGGHEQAGDKGTP